MKTLVIASFLIVFSIVTRAQELTPWVNERQENQRTRIHGGRLDGDLTRREALLINKEQKHIRRSERRAKADGDVTVRERRKLDRKQDIASRHIRRAKNNEANRLTKGSL
jgi:hypothetical protein